ncbi:MAG: hypothetical protein LBD14_06960 [Puniceicoccales bacterium]|jgi:Arc/MetJ-type ribon-helix-helix transcriptional regulator|nr:hypothetical protein [Puniceicoccales bacterium]
MNQRLNDQLIPCTISLSEAACRVIVSCRDVQGFRNASNVVRHAIEQFDFNEFSSARITRQVSVRLPTRMREELLMHARRNSASISNIIREALHALSVKPTQIPTKDTVMPDVKKTVKKPVAAKAPVKKAAAPASKPAVAKKAPPAKKKAPVPAKKTVPVKKAAPAPKAAPAKKTVPVKKAPVAKAPAKKTVVAKKPPAKKK